MITFTVYKTTCLINTCFYYGLHKTNNPEDSYLGSGVVIRQAVKKHRRENFCKEVLFSFPTRKEAELKEIELIFLEKDNPLCWNIAKGGEAGWEYVNESGMMRRYWKTHRGEMCEAISKGVKRKWAEPEHYASHTAVNNRADVKAKQREGHLKQWERKSEENVEKFRKEHSEMWADPKRKATMVKNLQTSLATPERREIQRKSARAANHFRWHEKRGILKIDCGLCVATLSRTPDVSRGAALRRIYEQ